ncbi:hypothetical protein [Ureibacillus sinduriensis]|uniref:Uncharacterized protein n=1 Tax=Ureibacillus sinduriensis BLB-1 = JCM 15800 TaxID=1384057 RepID=A0A0A3HUV1_9BACL|nr:hypothetical protein [Ureibacillus sinduriensis]KGR76346.1 hypothetical protein CD33_07325 [Ureibacillus sinduriensis BLB-1 = JCM 15800]
MKNKENKKSYSVTLTNGRIKNLIPECRILKIRGSVALYQDLKLERISTHGYSIFHSQVVAEALSNSGSCVIKENCVVDEVTNTGNLKMKNGQIYKIFSSGKLSIEQTLQSKQFHSIGIVQANVIHSERFQLKLSGTSRIERLITHHATVEKENLSFPLLKKKLICKYIKGSNLQLANTDAEVVEGDIVVINKHCNIQTLYYKENYSISSFANVQQIIRSEM